MGWSDDKPKLRSFSCWSCIHCGSQTAGSPGKPEKVKCEITKRSGSLKRGNYCDHFEFNQRSNAIGDDGILIRNRQPLDYKTEIQWKECGRKIRSGAAGVEMHSSRLSKRTYTYYLIEDTEEE